MKYVYLYQTKDNENRKGEIKAPNRAEAYALLRKQGIKPYRVIGDDPAPWRKWVLRGAIIAGGMLVSVLVAVAIAFALVDRAPASTMRHQLAGDDAYIRQQSALGWKGVFAAELDRRLAVYSQPGWNAFEPAVTSEEETQFTGELGVEPRLVDEDRAELRELLGIVREMRSELGDYVASGGTIGGYFSMLDERQQEEAAFRAKAFETLRRAAPADAQRVWLNQNIRLKDRGLATIPKEAVEAASPDAIEK